MDIIGVTMTGFEKAKIRRHTVCGFFYKNYQ